MKDVLPNLQSYKKIKTDRKEAMQVGKHREQSKDNS